MNADDLKFGAKVQKQIPKRGWTMEDIRALVRQPVQTAMARDQRHQADGTRRDDPATAYLRKDGHYVVVNDTNGDIVQISDRTRPWRSPFQGEGEQ